jgi:hypothetical protein
MSHAVVSLHSTAHVAVIAAVVGELIVGLAAADTFAGGGEMGLGGCIIDTL